MLDGSNAHVEFPKSSSRFEFITADIHTDATTFTDLILNSDASHRKVEFHEGEIFDSNIAVFSKKWIFSKNRYYSKSGYFQDGKMSLTATNCVDDRMPKCMNIRFSCNICFFVK